MAFIIGALAILEMIAGGLIFMAAKSAIHEILAAILLGMGVVALGVAVLINRSDEQIAVLKGQVN